MKAPVLADAEKAAAPKSAAIKAENGRQEEQARVRLRIERLPSGAAQVRRLESRPAGRGRSIEDCGAGIFQKAQVGSCDHDPDLPEGAGVEPAGAMAAAGRGKPIDRSEGGTFPNGQTGFPFN